jgi:ribonuclease Y
MAQDNQDLLSLEKKLLEKEERLEVEKKELEKEKEKIKEVREEYKEKLEKISSLTAEEARKEFLHEVEQDEVKAAAKIIKEREEEAKLTADKNAKEILVDSMRHGATNYIAEFTVSVVKISDEDIKGRIIGKEGRNIRAFEQATGVDVDLDEEGVIRLSSFDQVRREVAKRSLEKLIKDTRIQPFRIEEIVEQTKKEVEKVMFEEGEKLTQEAGVYNLTAELVVVL